MAESMKITNFTFSPLKLLLLFVVLVGGIYFAQRSGTNPAEYKNDFNVYYFAAQETLAGRTPYEKSLGEWTPYLYTPLLAELLVPLVLLPLPVAAYLWFLINALALVAALRMSLRLAHLDEPVAVEREADRNLISGKFILKARPKTVVTVVTLLILLRFVLDNFDFGQVNLIVTALAVAHIYFWIEGKKFLSALVLALAVAIKITPIVIVIFHIAKLRLKYALACLALSAAVITASFLPFGAQAGKAFDEFFFRTVANGQGFNLAYHGNQSMQGAVHRIMGYSEVSNPSLPHIKAIAIGFLLLAFIAAIVRQNELVASLPFYCLSVLLSPLSWKQHFVILLLPITFLAARALSQSTVNKVLIVILLIGFALFNLTSPKIVGSMAAEWCDRHSLIFAGALMLYLFTLSYHGLPVIAEKIEAHEQP
jgi:hypothetical protein